MHQENEDMLQRISIYVACLGIADQMLIAYRALFLVIETLFLAFAIGLLTIKEIRYNWILASIGLVLCISFFFLSSWGRKRVDYWRDKIFEEAKGTDLEKVFKIYQPIYTWRIPSPFSPRFWLDLLLPVMITIMWIFLLRMGYG